MMDSGQGENRMTEKKAEQKQVQIIVRTTDEIRHQIKVAALLSKKTMQEYILEACREKMKHESD